MTAVSNDSLQTDEGAAIPKQSLASLFLRFLRFGALAWGGPVAQIAMLRQSLVDEQRWIRSEHFNRVLALYQVLPGPEAHELCVYFGMLARGRIGGLIAGLAFMLPGFTLMFLLSWAYAEFGLDMHGDLAILFATIQAAVVALIVRAAHRIGMHVILNAWLWAIAIAAFAAQLLGVHFGVILIGGGILYYFAMRNAIWAASLLVACTVALGGWFFQHGASVSPEAAAGSQLVAAPHMTLFWSGLKAGSLTFGGAYTAIPLLQRDAVTTGSWMTNAQFMDGIALSGLLPAPLIIFSTFVGYVGGGPSGALVMTIGTFLPAFAITLFAHKPLERLIREKRMRHFLDGLTAAVVGLIAATALSLLIITINSVLTGLIFVAALSALIYWKSRWLIPLVVAGAALVGLIVTAAAP